jgi:hypothetical protein
LASEIAIKLQYSKQRSFSDRGQSNAHIQAAPDLLQGKRIFFQEYFNYLLPVSSFDRHKFPCLTFGPSKKIPNMSG